MEIKIQLNAAARPFIANIEVDKGKCNCYKSSSTNKRKTLALIKVGMSKATPASIVDAHVQVFTNLLTTDSNCPFAGMFPDVCYPIKVTDANQGMILEGDEPMWITIGKDGMPFVGDESEEA